MATFAFSESSVRNGYIRSGPSEQLRPTESGFTCFTAFQKASVVCAEIIVSPPRPTAAEIITGSSLHCCRVLVEDLANGHQSGLGVERVEDGLDQQQVDAAGDERAHLLRVGGLHLVEGDHAEAGIVGVGRVRERDGQRADGAGHEALAAGSRCPMRSAHSRHCRADCSLISQARSLRNGSSMIFW